MLVNGQPAGRWYTAPTNPTHRWADSDFILPSSLTRDRTAFDIEIRTVDGQWTESRYELWAGR